MKKNMNILSTIILSLTLTLFSITTAIKITLNLKQVYYMDINHLNISETSGYSKDTIVENYNYLIDYLNGPREMEFDLPSLSYSEQGKIHFIDVKNLFVLNNRIFYITLIILVFSVYFLYKYKFISFLKWTYRSILLILLFIGASFLIDFNKAFNFFHQLAFTNDYWLFDPVTDPVINILPEAYFFHSGMLILFILLLMITIYRLIYKKFKK